jgi:hypothetical protein
MPSLPHTGGETLHPFQMVDLEYTPGGASESDHAMEGVDLNSVRGLRAGGLVPIYYSAADPNLAQIAGGTRASWCRSSYCCGNGSGRPVCWVS